MQSAMLLLVLDSMVTTSLPSDLFAQTVSIDGVSHVRAESVFYGKRQLK